LNQPALQELLPAPGRRTLDLACGEGRLTRLLRSLGHTVVGVDASPTMVRLAATREEAVRVVLGDGGRLPFADAAFDLVVAYMCLHDFDEMPRAVAEIGRVLEPSGRLCLAIPHPVNSAGSFLSKDADAPFVISGSYMAPMPTRDTIERGGIRLTFHSEHRPLEAYARALESAGLLIEALRETVPGDEVVAGELAARRWQRIPMFLHMRVVNPA
jgi:SAM-dependent methyltransferase